MHNHSSPSCEVELATGVKILKLRHQGFLEKVYVSLIIPWFATVKLMVDGVVKVIRVAWDCSANEHNNS